MYKRSRKQAYIPMNDALTKFLQERFVSDVGFASCEDSPFPGLENAISMVFHLSEAVVDQIAHGPTHTYFHHYRTMNACIDSVSHQLVMALQMEGFRAAAVPASQSCAGMDGLYSHKKAAVRAGLGYIGKSALFLSHRFGPRVRLGTVFTDAPLKTLEMPPESLCGNCDLCVRACPAMAIRNTEFAQGKKREDLLDAKACSDYMKEKFKHIGRGSVCGICMQVCPYKR